MKEQQSHLKEQLRLESERKKELKLELENDHQRIVQLERQLKEKRRSRRKSLDPLTSNGDQGWYYRILERWNSSSNWRPNKQTKKMTKKNVI